MDPPPREDRPVRPRPDVGDLDLVCRRFDEAWEGGGRPRIEDYLGWLPPAAAPELLDRLIRIEMGVRRLRGEDPRPEEYAGRFAGVEADSPAGAVATWPLADATADLLEQTGSWGAEADALPRS